MGCLIPIVLIFVYVIISFFVKGANSEEQIEEPALLLKPPKDLINQSSPVSIPITPPRSDYVQYNHLGTNNDLNEDDFEGFDYSNDNEELENNQDEIESARVMMLTFEEQDNEDEEQEDESGNEEYEEY